MSKIWIITKNYLKLIFRTKAMLIITILGTLLVVAAVSSAFRTLLDKAEQETDFSVGYEMQDDSKYKIVESAWTEGLAKENITVKNFSKADPEKIVKDGEADVFVVFGKDGYRIVGSDKKEMDTRIVQYVLYNMDMMMNGSVNQFAFPERSLPTEPRSTSENYYSIVEIEYFMSICSIFLCMIYYTERKNNILTRFRTGSAGSPTRYFGKLFSCVLTSWLVQVLIMVGLVSLLFDVQFGKPMVSIGILLLATVAYASFGMVFFELFENSAVSIGLMFTALWFAGYLGGSFESYMYSSFSENIKRLSPTYYVNRSLVELSVKGSSDYLLPCVGVMLLMIVVCVSLGLIITAKKKEV